MSIALACLLVVSASLVSAVLEQRREERAIQENRDRDARETFHVRVTVDRRHLDQSPSHH
jgi:hypothetical protein